jgi:hypothetical protein
MISSNVVVNTTLLNLFKYYLAHHDSKASPAAIKPVGCAEIFYMIPSFSTN